METTTNDVTAGASPPAVRRFVLLCCLAAALVIAAALSRGAEPTVEPFLDPAVVLLAVIGIVSIIVPLRLHLGAAVQGFSLVSAATLSIAVVSDTTVAIAAAAVMATVGYAIATRSLLKTAFNAAQNVIGAGVALGIVAIATGGGLQGDVLSLEVGAAFWIAGLLISLITMGLVAELMHRLGGGQRWQVLQQSLRPALATGVVEVLVALLLTILAERSASAILLALPTFAGFQLAYRGLAADRAAARQAEVLHGTSRQLLDGALDDVALAKAVAGLRELFEAERAALVGPSDEPSPELRDVVATVRSSGTAQRSQSSPSALAAPVLLDGQLAGVVAVAGRRGLEDWGPTDLDLLSTVGGEIAATLRTRRLLEQVRHERELLAAETSKLTDVLASASDGIVVLDGDGRLEACNPAMSELLGLDTAPIGARWHEVLHLEDETERRLITLGDHPLTRAIGGDAEATHADAALRRPDGSVRWLRCSVAPVRSDAHRRRGVVLVAVDRTKEREVEQLRGDFIATVSHELRTPLTPLRGFLGVLRDHGDALDEERRSMMVDAMETQVMRLSDLIADLLQVAEVDAGAVEVHTQLLDVTAAVRDVVAGSAPEHRARISTSLEPTTAVADPVALRRIVEALVSNACKHTDGAAVVSTSRTPDRVVVAVDDEGPGIAAADRSTVFLPFRRLGDHLHRPQGPGVGLAVARALAEAQDATLEIVDRDGPGVRFELSLPGTVDRLRSATTDMPRSATTDMPRSATTDTLQTAVTDEVDRVG